MDSTGVPNDFNTFCTMKDRVFAINSNQNLSKGWVYNPSVNDWELLSGFDDGINGTLLNFFNNYSNYGFARFSSDYTNSNFTYKLFNLFTNTWIAPSMINAPADFDLTRFIVTLPTKMMVIREDQFYFYDISSNQWNQTSMVNAPIGFDWKFIEMGTDSTVYFTKNNYNSSYDTTTIMFKKYNFQQNIWTNEFPPLLKNRFLRGKTDYIGKRLNKLYFHIGKDLEEYDTNINQWHLIENPNETPNGRWYYDKMYLFNNKIFKLGGLRSPGTIFYNDGYIYNLETGNWEYIPSVFSQEAKLYNDIPYEIRSMFVINDKYLLSFFNQPVGINGTTNTNAPILNQSAIMQLSGSTNQTTQKLMYLYKKL